MNMIIGKKQIVMASLVAVLGLAVFVNWYYSGESADSDSLAVDASQSIESSSVEGTSEDQNAAADPSEYFANAKLTRSAARDEAVETLQAVIASCDQSSEAAKTAVQELSSLNAVILLETDIESLVTAKVGGECICNIKEGGIEVIVPKDNLDETSVLAISDIIHSSCGTVENIRITGA